MSNYDDIINMPHYESSIYPKMSLYNRSAQFAPFAALTGFSWAIKETARLVDNKIEIDEGLKSIINNELLKIKNNIKEKPLVTITYFVKDKYKNGGKYISVTSNVNKLDTDNSFIILTDKTKIKLDDIINIKLL